MNITLDEVLKLPPDQPCKKTLQVFILDKGSMSSYGKDKCVATVNRAEATKAMNGSVHDIDNYNMMTKDKGVLIQDFIPKNE